MKHFRRLLVLMFCMAMVLALPFTAEAAKKVKLSKKKVTQPCNTAMTILELKGAKGKKIKWTSSNKKVVTIDSNGSNRCILVSRKAGKAKVKAKYKGKTYTCKVTVKEKPQLETDSLKLNVGSLDNLMVWGTAKKVTWSVEDESIVRLSVADEYMADIEGLKAGKTKITATVGKKKMTCTVTVSDKPEDKENMDDDE